LLLDGRAFLQAEDFSKAVLYAAMATELFLFALVERQLLRVGFGDDLAASFARAEGPRNLRAWLEGYKVITSQESAQIQSLAVERNALAHPKLGALVPQKTRKEARAAVKVASRLLDLYQQP